LDPARLPDPLSPPRVPAADAPGLPAAPSLVWRPHPKFQDRIWVHVLLLLLTVASTTIVGTSSYLAFVSDYATGVRGLSMPIVPLLIRGLWYSATILAILGCHEMGHYLACRYYDVDASRPYFLPFPFAITGTLGAFIRIREPIPTKRMLFDIGIAGPLAGFVIAVPTLFIGIAMSHVVRVPPNFVGFELGEPLLFKLASRVLWGPIADGYSLNLHPMAFAAWFGLLATALNLFPVGQLDGGHITYAVLGRRSTHITFVTLAISVVLAYFYSSWIVWTGLMAAMLVAFGPQHPRVFDEEVPLDRTRLLLALVALAIFIICFTPAPIEPTELLRH
jgi:membrane-associated protease RseP (regulator of RpoE activity)